MPTIRTNDAETYYERRGSGQPIVFLHGAILDHSQWDRQVDALSEQFTTITYDVRGHGRTGRTRRNPYSIELFAEDLGALLGGLDLEQPVLCGHSMGGCIAQVYAARHPERVAGLVLSSTFGPPVLSRSEWLQRSLGLRSTVPPVRVFGYERVEKAMVGLTELFQREASGDYDAIEALRADAPPMTTDEFVKVIRSVDSFRRSNVDLAAITMPTLVLYGENEPGFVRQHAARFAATLPDVAVERLPGSGHASNLDDPERYTETLERFLENRVDPDQSEALMDESGSEQST
ncbi:alpha/beta hydrolase fold protein [Salinarchaeum sp. Harcht-Bsk1]|uniref:alpha/beta fold hydrolase n=1 Tax=Salinarchaeum sp. Harcht-Bsk1 TaxID=1333523 RepID=UPI0003423E6A|nr:alpha/beta hydrolase [Salinarchaeum sp. Harcht-Bsk1]AGN00275.1 alpha/beta hydrolase fold protein [Salinarchaeum sp. Harcht-Bsk1]